MKPFIIAFSLIVLGAFSAPLEQRKVFTATDEELAPLYNNVDQIVYAIQTSSKVTAADATALAEILLKWKASINKQLADSTYLLKDSTGTLTVNIGHAEIVSIGTDETDTVPKTKPKPKTTPKKK